MDAEAARIQQVILKPRRPAGFGQPQPKHLETWISESNFAEWIRDYLRYCTSSACFDLGPYSIHPLQKTYSFAREHPRLFDAGYLAVAGTDNGDKLVCAFREPLGPVFILSHETLWTTQSTEEQCSEFIPVSPSLTEFFEACVTDTGLPGDYYDALERSNAN